MDEPTKIKRYVVFAHSQYYPLGGWNDRVDSFDDLEKAKTAARESLESNEWSHVVDLVTNSMVGNYHQGFDK